MKTTTNIDFDKNIINLMKNPAFQQYLNSELPLEAGDYNTTSVRLLEIFNSINHLIDIHSTIYNNLFSNPNNSLNNLKAYILFLNAQNEETPRVQELFRCIFKNIVLSLFLLEDPSIFDIHGPFGRRLPSYGTMDLLAAYATKYLEYYSRFDQPFTMVYRFLKEMYLNPSVSFGDLNSGLLCNIYNFVKNTNLLTSIISEAFYNLQLLAQGLFHKAIQDLYKEFNLKLFFDFVGAALVKKGLKIPSDLIDQYVNYYGVDYKDKKINQWCLVGALPTTTDETHKKFVSNALQKFKSLSPKDTQNKKVLGVKYTRLFKEAIAREPIEYSVEDKEILLEWGMY